MKESFIFYRSFYKAAGVLDKEQKAELLEAIIEFALNQTETKLEPLVEAMFSLIKPQLEANHRKYENGKKGGRPKDGNKPKRNQNESKPEPNANANVNGNEEEPPFVPPEGGQEIIANQIEVLKPNLNGEENGNGPTSRGVAIRNGGDLFGEPKPKPKPRKGKGSRLWQEYPTAESGDHFAKLLPDRWISYAVEQGFTETRIRQIANDFWQCFVGTKPGADVNTPKPVKLNWEQAWQSWIRGEAAKGFQGQPSGGSGKSMDQLADEITAYVDQGSR